MLVETLTQFEQGRIQGLNDAGLSNREVARRLGRSHKVVNSYLQDPAAYGNRKHTGRPSKLSDRERRSILREASNSTYSARQIQSHLNLGVSAKTIVRVIHKCKFIVRRRMRKAPFITIQHRQSRLAFAQKNARRDWSKIVWSDEKRFNYDGPDGNRAYWHDLRKDNLRFSRRNYKGGSVLVWACFGAKGRIKLVFGPRTIKTMSYLYILKKALLPYWKKHRQDNLTFMQDNAPPHVSRISRKWFEKNKIELLSWPANSPDLNPQENIWGILARRVYENNKQYHSTAGLKKAIVKAWHTIDQTIVDNLVMSMDTRV
ncbi:hypothetical protein B9Z55_024569 [Caenorhabditis nigoni]|uniref:Tc1-like transposase DDE domain-containing protein n=1 Tax=Caenorhabditis nigoni TaxID=1611254 RepID=A0A2G5SUL6_9PELO|nr:hypothetical protein B9Z55_024569 [Caenorhabditis nigoni]